MCWEDRVAVVGSLAADGEGRLSGVGNDGSVLYTVEKIPFFSSGVVKGGSVGAMHGDKA